MGCYAKESLKVDMDTTGVLGKSMLEHALKYRSVIVRKYAFTFHNLNCRVEEWHNIEGTPKLDVKNGKVTRDDMFASNFVVEKSGRFENTLGAFYVNHEAFPLDIEESPRIKWRRIRSKSKMTFSHYLKSKTSVNISRDLMAGDLVKMESKLKCANPYFNAGKLPMIGVALSKFEPESTAEKRFVLKTVTGHIRLRIYLMYCKRIDVTSDVSANVKKLI